MFVLKFFLFIWNNITRLLIAKYRLNVIYVLLLLMIASIFSFILSLSLCNPLLNQWDAIIHYLVMAKSIINTHNLTYNFYYLSNKAAIYPPFAPLIYSYVVYLSEGHYLRFLGPFYFILLTIVIFLITKNLTKNQTISLMAPILFGSLLVTQVHLSAESLYLDPPLVSYSSLTLYGILKYISSSDNKGLWLFVSSISSSLALLSNELGMVSVFFMLPFLMLEIFKSGARRPIFIFQWIVPFLIFYYWLILRKYPTDMLISSGALISLIVTMLYFLTRNLENIHPSLDYHVSCRKRIFTFGAFLLPLLFPAVFYLFNLITTGNISTRFMLKDYLVALSFGFIPSGGGAPITPIKYWQLYGLITSPWMHGYHLVLLLLGIIFIIRKRKTEELLLIQYICLLLLSCSLFYFANYQGTEYRRLFYFAPFTSIIATLGLMEMFTSNHARSNLITSLMLLVVSTTVYYNWHVLWNFYAFYNKIVNIVDYPGSVLSDIRGLLIFNSVWLALILTLRRRKPFNAAQYKSKIHAIVVIVMIVAIILSAINVFDVLSFMKSKNLKIEYLDSYEVFWTCRDVIRYYINNIKDDHVTLVFYGQALPIAYFADRKVVTISNIQGFIPLFNILNYNSTDELVEKLVENNIKYLLLGKEQLPGEYFRQKDFLNRYPEFLDVINNRSEKLADFNYFVLYKIKE